MATASMSLKERFHSLVAAQNAERQRVLDEARLQQQMERDQIRPLFSNPDQAGEPSAPQMDRKGPDRSGLPMTPPESLSERAADSTPSAQVEHLEKELALLNERIADLERCIEELNVVIERLQKEKEQIEQRELDSINASQKDWDDLRVENMRLKQLLQEYRVEKQRLEAALDDSQLQRRLCKRDLDTARDRIDELERQASRPDKEHKHQLVPEQGDVSPETTAGQATTPTTVEQDESREQIDSRVRVVAEDADAGADADGDGNEGIDAYKSRRRLRESIYYENRVGGKVKVNGKGPQAVRWVPPGRT